jgi:hypothetical protein
LIYKFLFIQLPLQRLNRSKAAFFARQTIEYPLLPDGQRERMRSKEWSAI